jgi:hypothetical protein
MCRSPPATPIPTTMRYDLVLTAPLSGHQVMINGHALCPPLSFFRGCDPSRPGTTACARICRLGAEAAAGAGPVHD